MRNQHKVSQKLWTLNIYAEQRINDEMKAPERITIAMDEETFELLKKMKEDLGVSQSELMRE